MPAPTPRPATQATAADRSAHDHIHALGSRTPELKGIFVSPSPNPLSTGTDFAPAAGSLAKAPSIRPGGITIYNDSCSMLYVRLVLDVPPYPPESAKRDSGTVEVAKDGGDGG